MDEVISVEIQTNADLDWFTGSENFYRWNGMLRSSFLTDGAHHVAETRQAYWLMDEIGLGAVMLLRKLGYDQACFQVWKLTVKDSGSATLVCEDGNDNVLFRKSLPYTSFPKVGIALWAEQNEQGGFTIMLPSEH